MVKIMKNLIKMDDLGVPPCSETSSYLYESSCQANIVDRLRRRVPDVGRCHFEMVALHEEGMEHLKAARYEWLFLNMVGFPLNHPFVHRALNHPF